MAEYITRESVMEAIESLPGTIPSGDPIINVICKTLMERLTAAIEKIPINDAVLAVRCKDCTHYREKMGECSNVDGPFDAVMEPDDFCSYGERRKNG